MRSRSRLHRTVSTTCANRGHFIVVTYDLTDQTMVHGKKGFDRLVYACKKALGQTLTWLSCQVNHSSKSYTKPFPPESVPDRN